MLQSHYKVPSDFFEDDRGVIAQLFGKVNSDAIVFISSVAGAKRANHYHRMSSHWCVLTKGEVEYYEKCCCPNCRVTKKVIKPFEPFYTGPLDHHLMKFTKDSDMICLRIDGAKDKDSYEEDLVRLDYDLEKEFNEQHRRN